MPAPLKLDPRIAQLLRLPDTEAALDQLYNWIDGLLRAGDFEGVDALLAGWPLADSSTDILLGLLTATLPARSRLPARPAAFAAIEQTLTERGEMEPGLLSGLE